MKKHKWAAIEGSTVRVYSTYLIGSVRKEFNHRVDLYRVMGGRGTTYDLTYLINLN